MCSLGKKLNFIDIIQIARDNIYLFPKGKTTNEKY